MYDIFLTLKTTYFTGCADGSTPFMVRDNITYVIKVLEIIGENLVDWVLVMK